jgi:polyhydroxyalkanoate synthesis regulator phasin
MSATQILKTKSKTKQIQDELLATLSLEEILEFIQELSKKTLARKKSDHETLPPHIKQAIGESLEDYKRGEYTTLSSVQEIDEYLESLTA